MDEFHGCYKDGTDRELDYRWFASLYFLLRVILFVIYTVTPFWKRQYLIQILLFLFAALLFAVLRPYKSDWLNNVDVTMFLLLAAISCFSLYNLVFTWLGINIELWAFIVQYILIFIPLLYFIGYYLLLFCSKFESYHNALRSQNRRNQAEQTQEQDEFERDRAALVDSSHVPNFLDYIEDTRHERHVRLSSSHSWRTRPPDQDNNRPRLNRQSISNERSPLLTGSSHPSTSDSGNTERVVDGLPEEEEGSENATDQPVRPSEEYHTANSTNSNQGGYGTIVSTLVSRTSPPP